MSVESWKEEFFSPIGDEERDDPKAAAEHSLKKWQGTLPHALAKHGVIFTGAEIVSADVADGEFTDGEFTFNGTTCSLCSFGEAEMTRDEEGVATYWTDFDIRDEGQNYEPDPCHYCPLYLANNGYSCEAPGSSYNKVREAATKYERNQAVLGMLEVLFKAESKAGEMKTKKEVDTAA
jgi:hypothetical protein